MFLSLKSLLFFITKITNVLYHKKTNVFISKITIVFITKILNLLSLKSLIFFRRINPITKLRLTKIGHKWCLSQKMHNVLTGVFVIMSFFCAILSFGVMVNFVFIVWYISKHTKQYIKQCIIDTALKGCCVSCQINRTPSDSSKGDNFRYLT